MVNVKLPQIDNLGLTFTGFNIYVGICSTKNKKYVRKCLNKVCLGPSFEDRKSQFCHASAEKCCGSYGTGVLNVINVLQGHIQ